MAQQGNGMRRVEGLAARSRGVSGSSLACVGLVAICLAAMPLRVSAQRKAVSTPRRPPLTIEQQNAIGILDGLADQAKSIPDDATRIRIEAHLADAMWERDRERARKLYRRAFDEIDDLNESLIDPTSAPVGARQQLRVELFASIYKLDATYADQLARTLDDDPEMYDGSGLPFENLSDRSATLIGVATSIAPRDPQLAADLGRQSLFNGIPLEFSSLLAEIGDADRKAADQLARDAIQSTLQSASSPLDLWAVASYLFPDMRLGDVVGGAGAASPSDLKRACLESAYAVTARYVTALADFTATASNDTTGTPNPASLFMGQGLLMNYSFTRQLAPMYDAYDPERATAFRVLVAQIEGAAPAEARDRVLATTGRSESPDAVASLAADTTDPNLRATLYSRAAYLAMQQDGYTSAKTYIAKIDDPDVRARMLGPLARQAAMDAAAERRYEDAREIAADIADLDDRAAVFCDLARALVSAGKRMPALDLLDEADKALRKEGAVMTPLKARALVRVANVYASIDALRGFDVMRFAVDAVNKGLALEDGPPSNRNPGLLYRLAAYDASPGIEMLARSDYFRSIALAQGIDNKPLSILAQLAAVRGAMRPTTQKIAPTKPPETPKAKKVAAPGAAKPKAATPAASSP